MEDKVREYFEAGAERVWHLFPETQQARVFTSPTEFVDLTPTDEIDGEALLPGFLCRVSDLLALE